MEEGTGYPMDYHAKQGEHAVNYKRSGFTLTGCIIVIYVLFYLAGRHILALPVLAASIAVLSWFDAKPLKILVNVLVWIGNTVNRVTNPLVLFGIYVLAVIPVALLLKMFNKDILALKLNKEKSTYWLVRPFTDWKESFKRQF